jgi:hypothetical protein
MKLLRKLIAMAAPTLAFAIVPATVEAEDPAVLERDAQDRQQEKMRIRAIVGDAEAAGRERLANYIALETSLSVEDARAALAASARAATTGEAASAPVSDKVARQRHMDAAFAQALNRAEFAIPECAEEPETVIQRMRRNYHRAAGVKVQS